LGSRNPAPRAYRGPKSPADFLAEIGHVWIGLIEKIASDPDQNEALAGYFGVEPSVIADWIEARGRTRCSAYVTSGRRCANLVGVKVEYDPRIWAAERLRCISHGPG
jgi:hypothetical protein